MTFETRGARRTATLVLLTAAVACLALGPQAVAAGKKVKPKPAPVQVMPALPKEMPLPVAYSWAGYYVGGFAGGAHGLWTFDFYRNNNHGHTAQGEDGFEGGGWIGYNTYLNPNIIAGAEADLGLTNASQTNNIFDNDTSLAEFHSTASIRGRIGYAMDRALFYGTAGIAFANLTNEIQKGRNAGEQVVWDDQTRTGYAVGAGAEYAFTDHWLGRAEYLYENFGTVTMYNADGNQANFNNQLHQLRIGVSYKF